MAIDERLFNRTPRRELMTEKGYNWGEGLRRGMIGLATGKPYEEPDTTDSFEAKLALARAKGEAELSLDRKSRQLELEEKRKNRATADAEMYGTQQQPIQQPTEHPSAEQTQARPISQMTPQAPPQAAQSPQTQQQYLPVTTPVWDDDTQSYVNKTEMKKNEAYLSPEDIEANRVRDEITRSDAEDMLQTIREAKKGVEKGYFGYWGGLSSQIAPSSIPNEVLGMKIPGLSGEYGERMVWEQNLNKLLSGMVINVMTKMKQASKTGATGFGQLSNKELTVLREASTALNKGLMPEDAKHYLDQMEEIQMKFLYPEQAGGQPGVQQPQQQAPQQAPQQGGERAALMAELEQINRDLGGGVQR